MDYESVNEAIEENSTGFPKLNKQLLSKVKYNETRGFETFAQLKLFVDVGSWSRFYLRVNEVD